MLYIISGASRSGKTLLAKKILADKGITYISLDWLVMGFTNGIPEYGIHDLLFPDEIAKRSWSFLKAMLESMIYVEVDCVVEGEALLPELLVELRDKYPDQLRICFMGYTEISVNEKVKQITTYSTGSNDWLIEKPDDYIADHVKNMIAHSKMVKRSCKAHKMKYIDTSKNFEDALEETMGFLLKEF